MITLTLKAAEEVKKVMDKQGKNGAALRIYVSGGGCSGMSYGMSLEEKPTEEDETFETNGVKLIVDKTSMVYLDGSDIDYIEGIEGSGFKMNNPNATSTCGCGHSFQAKQHAQTA